jgi:hypothetical protein
MNSNIGNSVGGRESLLKVTPSGVKKSRVGPKSIDKKYEATRKRTKMIRGATKRILRTILL